MALAILFIICLLCAILAFKVAVAMVALAVKAAVILFLVLGVAATARWALRK